MRQIEAAPDELSYKLINYGVDTLVLNVRYADDRGKPKQDKDALLHDSLIEALNAWQHVAREKDEPVPVADMAYDGARLLMHPHGAGKGRWRWRLTCPTFTLTVSRGKLNGVIAQVRFSAISLWSHAWPGDHTQDIWPLVKSVQAFLIWLFGPASGRLHLQVSEIHLCADVTGWDVSACDWEHTFIGRARTRMDYPELPEVAGGPGPVVYVGRKLATLNFGGHGSPLSCCIYNKSLEIRTSGKGWFEPLWLLKGWDGESTVWRVEFRWKREALHEAKQGEKYHGVEEVGDLDPVLLSHLWTYCAGHTQGGEDGWPDGWLRCAVPTSDATLSRWPVHPAWAVVQSAFTLETEPAVNIHTGEVFDVPASDLAELIRQRHYEIQVKRLAQQIGGCATTLAAWIGGSDPSLVKVFGYLLTHLPAYALPELAGAVSEAELSAEYKARFVEQVEERRELYGVQHNEKKGA